MNNTTLFYKGYRARPEYVPDENIYYGTLIGIRDFVDFQADHVEDIEKEFHSAVDDYLEFCKEMGKEPLREFNGLINLQVSPELHMKIAAYAEEKGMPINKVMEQTMQALVQS